jgi:hypothetical protein
VSFFIDRGAPTYDFAALDLWRPPACGRFYLNKESEATV